MPKFLTNFVILFANKSNEGEKLEVGDTYMKGTVKNLFWSHFRNRKPFFFAVKASFRVASVEIFTISTVLEGLK